MSYKVFRAIFVSFLVLVPISGESAKIMVQKPMVFSLDGILIGNSDICEEDLNAMRADLIEDYGTFLVCEVAEEDLSLFLDFAGGGGAATSCLFKFGEISIRFRLTVTLLRQVSRGQICHRTS